jgi:hypothetical protein
MLDTFSEIKATMTQLKKNLEFLKSKDDVASTDIDFSRTTVIAYI